MKKILLITFLLAFTFGFAQQNNKSTAVIKNTPTITITSVSASPNPLITNTRITFKSSKNQLIHFSVKSLLGKTIFQEQLNSNSGINTIYFERNNIPKGMYIYTFQSETEVISKRLVIK
jgi:hypothetical protein